MAPLNPMLKGKKHTVSAGKTSTKGIIEFPGKSSTTPLVQPGVTMPLPEVILLNENLSFSCSQGCFVAPFFFWGGGGGLYMYPSLCMCVFVCLCIGVHIPWRVQRSEDKPAAFGCFLPHMSPRIELKSQAWWQAGNFICWPILPAHVTGFFWKVLVDGWEGAFSF